MKTLHETLSLQGKSSHEIKDKVQDVTSILGITSIISKYPTEISGGQSNELLRPCTCS